MATRPSEPLQGKLTALAGALSVLLVASTPVFAASDIDINCDEASAPTLAVAESEFTAPPVAVDGDTDSPDVAEADGSESKEINAEAEMAVPTKGSRQVYKRQMYRRDI